MGEGGGRTTRRRKAKPRADNVADFPARPPRLVHVTVDARIWSAFLAASLALTGAAPPEDMDQPEPPADEAKR
jgi:hypothetical protein